MLALFGSPSRSVVRQLRGARAAGRRLAGARRPVPAAAAARARAAVRRLLPRRPPSARQAATPSRRRAGRESRSPARPARGLRSEWQTCKSARSRVASGCICSRAWSSLATTAASSRSSSVAARGCELAAPGPARLRAVRRDELPRGPAARGACRPPRSCWQSSRRSPCATSRAGRLPPGAALRRGLSSPLRAGPGALSPAGARLSSLGARSDGRALAARRLVL